MGTLVHISNTGQPHIEGDTYRTSPRLDMTPIILSVACGLNLALEGSKKKYISAKREIRFPGSAYSNRRNDLIRTSTPHQD